MPCRPTVVQIYPPCSTPCPDVPDLTFQNDNLAGEGVFHENVDNTVGFFGISNTDGTIEVTLDSVNKVISLDLNPELLAGNFPDATTTSKGKVELAIDGEAQSKTSTTVVLTPSNLAALGATTSFAGLIEIATDAEAAAGVATDLAVSPASLVLVLGQNLKLGLANGTSSDTTFDFSGAKFELTAGPGLYRFNNSGLRIEGAPLDLATDGDLNLNGAKLQFAGSDMTASSLLGTTGAAGVPTSYPLTDFLLIDQANTSDSGATTLALSSGATFTVTYGTNGFSVVSFGTIFTGLLHLASTGKINFFGGSSQLSIAGVDVPADSFIRTDSAAGVVTSELVALYFGPHTVTEDYPIAPFIANRGFDPATVTLPDLAVVVASLIQDLAAVHKPVII